MHNNRWMTGKYASNDEGRLALTHKQCTMIAQISENKANFIFLFIKASSKAVTYYLFLP